MQDFQTFQQAGRGAGARDVVFTTGPDIGCPYRPPIGSGQHLDIAAVMTVLARPPHISSTRSRCRYPVGGDHRPVPVEVTPPRTFDLCQRIGQTRRVPSQRVNGLMQTRIPGGLPDPVVPHQIPHPSPINKPPQHHHRLLPRRQRPRPQPATTIVQQAHHIGHR